MNLPASVDASCRTNKIHTNYKASARKTDKALANRRFRHALKGIVRNVLNNQVDWDEATFDLPTFTNWQID